METLLRQLENIDKAKYGSIPFWSWNNKLEKDELIKQIHQMHEANCGGFIMHARIGLKTEYLSEEWFSLVETCLDEAKKLGMSAWIYDENGWPSGFVDGRLLEREDFRAPYLSCETKEQFDESALAVFGRKTDGSYYRIFSAKEPYDGVYECVYVHRSPSNSDILNPEVVTAFLSLTHEEYYKRFADRFGKELVGFFTDEPQYFRWATPFSYGLLDEWKKRYNEDALDGILALFDKTEQSYPYRVRYYSMMNDLYTNNFYKRIYDWCDAHNCKLTGHSVEETALFSQMYGGADCVPSYEYEHIPGVDNLGKVNNARLQARQVGSLARQLGKEQVLTETFACCGYDVKPKELKAIAEKQYVHGVNMMCQHLFPYSLAGQGKTDHPPCFSTHEPWWESFADFNTYFNRLGYMLANSQTLVNCLVINPMQSVYLKYDRFNEDRAFETDQKLNELMNVLNKYAILYDFADEKILAAHASIEGTTVRFEKQDYAYVIVPDCENLTASTKSILEKFLSVGGKVLFVGTPRYTDGVKDDYSSLCSNTTLEEIAKNGAIRLITDGKCEYTYRKLGDTEFLYLVNITNEEADVTLPHRFAKLDLLKLSLESVDKELHLQVGEGMILLPKEGNPPTVYEAKENITNRFRFVSCDKNNLTLDMVQVSLDGAAFGEEEPIQCAFDRLLRQNYKGKISLKFRFNVAKGVTNVLLRREKEKFLSSTLNGKPLHFTQSDFDILFEEADLSAALREGENEYVCTLDFYEHDGVTWALYDPEATESVRNCLWYDVMLENVYLLGNFSVDENRTLVPFTAPELGNNLQEKGLAYFSGSVHYSAKIFAKSAKARLTINGSYADVLLYVNGKKQANCLFDNSVEITLDEGKENDIEMNICSTLRNTFGPFHHFMKYENALCTLNFTYRGSWKDGKCEDYNENYVLVPFGVSDIHIAFEK